jgi:hypothetical protein
MATALNQIEEEVVFLKAIYDLIDSMVNYQMLSMVGGKPYSSVVFESSIHHQLFIILLTDFLSQTDKDAPIKKKSYVRALKFISEHPVSMWTIPLTVFVKPRIGFRTGLMSRCRLRFGSRRFQRKQR